MTDMIRMLLESRLPSDAIEGDHLSGQSMGSIADEQSGELDPEAELFLKLQKLASGMRPTPSMNSLQLDR